MIRLHTISALSLLLVLGGCGLLDPQPFREEQRRLDFALAQWSARGPASYRMVYQRSCFCILEVVQPVEIRVRNGAVEERRYEELGSAVPDELTDLFLPVEHIFEEIQRALRERAATVRVDYDPVLGFPVETFIDWRHSVADDEIGHRVLELAEIP